MYWYLFAVVEGKYLLVATVLTDPIANRSLTHPITLKSLLDNLSTVRVSVIVFFFRSVRSSDYSQR